MRFIVRTQGDLNLCNALINAQRALINLDDYMREARRASDFVGGGPESGPFLKEYDRDIKALIGDLGGKILVAMYKAECPVQLLPP